MTQKGVVILHRHSMVAEGIAAALGRFPSIVPLAVSTDSREAVLWGDRADAVAIDEQLTGAEVATAALRQKGVRVVFIGENGAGGEGVHVSPGAPVATLASALVPGMGNGNGNGHGKSHPSLTKREREVLGLVARGMAAKQVARHLGISPKTVERHKGHIFAKLGVPNQAAAVHMSIVKQLGAP